MMLYLFNPMCVFVSLCLYICYISVCVYNMLCNFFFSSAFCIGPVDVSILAKCNPCLSNPCKNDGTCSNHPVDFYRCTCPYGFKVQTHLNTNKNISLVAVLRY